MGEDWKRLCCHSRNGQLVQVELGPESPLSKIYVKHKAAEHVVFGQIIRTRKARIADGDEKIRLEIDSEPDISDYVTPIRYDRLT